MKNKIVVQRTAAVLRRLSDAQPKLAIVLGSGFGRALEGIRVEQRIPYAKLPGFPKPGVAGHAGELRLGRFEGVDVVILSGRAHFYEGHEMETVTFPVSVLAAFGIRDLLLTNAAGGINRRLHRGDFMVLTDHINFMGVNPLRGLKEACGDGFVDLTQAYNPMLTRLLERAAKLQQVPLRKGVYMAVSGPSYETPAEIRAFARLGADAVGMSTVPEVVVARKCGLRVAALSCITNLAASRSRGRITHAEVLDTGKRVQSSAAKLLESFVRLYGKECLRNRAEAVSCEPEKFR